MKINEKGLEIIKRYEGFRANAYKCPAGKWTIGFGHTLGVKKGDFIRREDAEKLLRKDLVRYEKMVSQINEKGKYNFNENEFSALVSFAFNIGNVKTVTANGTRSKKEITAAMLKYRCATVNGKKIVLAGLEKRRKEEVALFNTPVNNQNVSRETSFDDVVKMVISGKLGNGTERKKRVTELGFNYAQVQKEVNRRLKK